MLLVGTHTFVCVHRVYMSLIYLFFCFVFLFFLVVCSDLDTYFSSMCFSRCTHVTDNQFTEEKINTLVKFIQKLAKLVLLTSSVLYKDLEVSGSWWEVKIWVLIPEGIGNFLKDSDRITDLLCWDAIEKNMEAITNLDRRSSAHPQDVTCCGNLSECHESLTHAYTVISTKESSVPHGSAGLCYYEVFWQKKNEEMHIVSWWLLPI